jgi:hypothetical protein
MDVLELTIGGVPVALLLGFLLPSRGRALALLGLVIAVGFWIVVVVNVAVSDDSTASDNGDGWSLGEYVVFGGLNLAMFFAIWMLCAWGGRRLRLRFWPKNAFESRGPMSASSRLDDPSERGFPTSDRKL